MIRMMGVCLMIDTVCPALGMVELCFLHSRKTGVHLLNYVIYDFSSTLFAKLRRHASTRPPRGFLTRSAGEINAAEFIGPLSRWVGGPSELRSLSGGHQELH